ncbi:MAG: hypothetical protein II839_02810, partial [Kiritimatiellae bacterium]|nr:hypothetical protein [Kiritimatiellia bacterium]
LTVTANANTICYGDEPAAAGVAYDGFAEGEDASVLAGTLAYAYNYAQYGDVGSYTITPSGLSGGNYEIQFAAGSLVVTQKVVGLSWNPDPATFVYDGTPKAPTATATGLVNGDEIAVTVTGQQTAAGSYTATASALTGAKSGNYALPSENTTAFTIDAAAITITIAGYEGTYDGVAHPATVTEVVPADATVEWSADNGATWTADAPTIKDAGTKSVVARASKTNYTTTTSDAATLAVTKAALSVTANAKAIVYGDAPANNGVSYSGFVAAEDAGVLGGELAYAYNYAQYGDVGSYTITPSGLTSDNYAIAFNAGTLTVAAKEVGLAWSGTALTYTGEAQGPTATATGLVNGDEIGVTVTGQQTAAGSYTATASALTGAKSGNYALPADPTTTFAIGRAQATVRAEDKSKSAGASDPTLTVVKTGLFGNDDVSYTTLSRAAGEAIGTYVITVTGDAVQGNYDVTFVNGTFTIGSNPQTVIWVVDGASTSGTVEYGETPSHEDPSKTDPTGKYVYAFTGWTPALGAVTVSPTIFTATFSTNIATPLALPLRPATNDVAVAGNAATVTLAPTGTIAGVTYEAVPPAAWNEGTATFSFTGLAWNEGTNWSVTATQGEEPLAETASNEGRFYAKASTTWFAAGDGEIDDAVANGLVGYTAAAPSASNETVRIRATIEMTASGQETEPELDETDKGAFAVLKLEGDETAAYYAWNGSGWVKLAGAEPKDGTVDYLAVYDLAADTPSVRYYIDGVALHAAQGGGSAIPLRAGTRRLEGVYFSNASAVSGLSAEQDVSYVATVGATPYTNAADVVSALAAADKAAANGVTATLLADVGGGPVQLAAGEQVTVVAGSHSNGLEFVASGAPTYKVVETAGTPATTTIYTVALNEATVVWIAEDGTPIYSTNVTIGVSPVFLGGPLTKSATDAALFTWTGWTNAAGVAYGPEATLPAVAAGGTNYMATFKTWTKIARPTVATGRVYDGTEQTGVTVAAGSTATGAIKGTNAGSYPVTVALDSADSVWSDATDPAAATARETVTADWSIARAQATVTADDASKVAGNPDPASFTATVAGAVDGETLNYTVARVAGEAAGTYDIVVTLGSNPNYDVTATKGTFTITDAVAMAITVADETTGATGTNYFDTVQAALDSAAGANPAVETVVLLADATETVTVTNAVALDLDGKTLTGDVTNGVAGVTLSGGTVTGAVVADGAPLAIAGGTYGGSLVTNGTGSISITGGHFAADPTEFVAAGYYAAGDSTAGWDVLPQKSILGTTITVAGGTYTGAAQTPAPTVVAGGDTLTPETDYTVSYANNVDA